MKKLIVSKISASNLAAESLPQILDAAHVQFNAIDNVNWKESYPYAPKVEFRMAHNNEALLIHYRVSEATVRATAPADNGHVWEDSCVEFFSIPAEDGLYYNVECNCAGTLLIGGGKGRENRQHAPQDVLNQVQRWSSLGRQPFEEKEAPATWEMCLIIPRKAFFLSEVAPFSGRSIRANFYKCGDKLTTAHFLSWNPIELEKPNFHCPQFFGELKFE